jgi:hypothetical protein
LRHIRQLSYILTALLLLFSILILPSSAAAVTAVPTPSAVFVDGREMPFDAYFINGNNYFKIRDIAYALSGSAKQFQVTYDERTRQIDLTLNTAYTPEGDELTQSGQARSAAAYLTNSEVYLNGEKLSLIAYFVNDNNYVKLRDLAAVVDFGVTYNTASRAIVIDTSVGYTPDKPEETWPNDLNVTFIGDSIGIDIAPYLKQYFPNIYIDAKVSRQFSAAKGIVQGLMDSGELGPVVVIELGANGTISESHLRALIELIGSDRKVVFVNVQVPRSWCEGDNATLANVVPEYDNAIIADWYSASIHNSGYFYKDGVHPNATGSPILAKLIADAVMDVMSS